MLSGQTKSRLLTSAGCLAWLAAMAWLLASGGYAAFLAPRLWWLLAAAAVVLGGFIMVTIARGEHRPVDTGLRTKWLVLLLPLAFLVLVPCGQAGSFAFDQRSTAGLGPGGASLLADDTPTTAPDVAPDAPPITVTLSELYENYATLRGRRVTVIGMVNPRKDLPPGSVLLFRFTIACCAADAQPVAVLLSGPDVQKYRRDSWVQVTGIVWHDRLGKSTAPAIRAESVTKIRRPMQPYLQ